MTDDLGYLFDEPLTPPNPAAVAPKCRRHVWVQYATFAGCARCDAIRDDGRARLGRNNRKRGGSHELAVARTYGGRKIGPLGGPVDIEGARWATQVKTHAGVPPRWLVAAPRRVSSLYTVAVYNDVRADFWTAPAPLRWHGIFALMEQSRRLPRLLERYLPGRGVSPRDYFVVRAGDDPAGFTHDALYVAYAGRDWLDLFGVDAA